MTEIQKSRQCLDLEGLVIEYWNLKFICNLLVRRLFGGVLGIYDFRHKTPRQCRISLTWPKGPGFSGLNKKRDLCKNLRLSAQSAVTFIKCINVTVRISWEHRERRKI